MSPARRNAASTFNVLTGKFPFAPAFPRLAACDDVQFEIPPPADAVVFWIGSCQCSTVRRHFNVLTQPPAQETTSSGHVSRAQSSVSVAEERISAARCVSPARMYSSTWPMWGSISLVGSARSNSNSCDRTPLAPSSISGLSLGRSTLIGWGSGLLTGREVIAVVRYTRESRRWVEDLEDRRERWWENWEDRVGAVVVMD